MPRARFLFGSSFPVLTNQALQEFGQKNSLGRAQKDSKTLPPLPRTYLQNIGLLPHYGGYVPGETSQREAPWTGILIMCVGWEGAWLGGLEQIGGSWII